MMDTNPKAQRCKARNRQGKQCAQPAILGGAVCRFHGGGAPQVRAAAQARLQDLILPSIARIEKIISKGDDVVAERAARGILDRTGFKEPEKIEVTGAGGGPLIDLHALEGEKDDALAGLGALLERMLRRFPEDGEGKLNPDADYEGPSDSGPDGHSGGTSA